MKGEEQFLKNGTKKKKTLKIEEDQTVDDLESEGVVALLLRKVFLEETNEKRVYTTSGGTVDRPSGM